MPEASSPPSERQSLPFSEFLPALFQAFAKERLHFCVLRNYEEFPGTNLGNDLDFLILQSELPHAIRALRSILGIRIVGYCERDFVANVFLEGASSTPGSRSIQVDFFWSLSSKGPKYLATEAVLQSANPRQAGSLTFLVPSPVHEAIISLLASLLHGGFIKEKYFPIVQRTFASNRSEVIAGLLPQFGLKTATRLADSVIDGDRQRILGCRKQLRVSVTLRSLLQSPFRGAWAIARYYAVEVRVRFSPRNLEKICILGPHDRDNTTIIEGLMPMLHSSAQTVEKCYLGPQLFIPRKSSGIDVGTDYRVGKLGGWLVSMAKAAWWLVEEWLRQFTGKKNLKLRIRENCYHDLFIDPTRFRYYGPVWFARLVGKLVPSPDLWILLDTPAEVMQSGDQPLLSAETLRQLEAYRSFVKTRKRYVILDAGKPVACVTEEAYAAIIDMLAQRTEKQLINASKTLSTTSCQLRSKEHTK